MLIPVTSLIVCSLAFIQSQRIPDHLVHCYRSGDHYANNGNTSIASPTLTPPPNVPRSAQLPYTLQLFIELLRKIEDANPTALDMRQLSVQLTHRMRLDGIERATDVRETAHVTPFRANGIQTAKFQLLLQLISDSGARLPFGDWLTPAELCQLHRMLSATVEPWERGDEWRVCPLSAGSAERVPLPWLKRNHVQDPESGAATVSTARLSRCPLEGGCVRSREYGSLTVGTVVASLAAGLQPQRVGVAEFFRAKDLNNVIADEPHEEVDDEYVDQEQLFDEFDSMRKRRRRRRNVENMYGRLRSSLDSVDNTYAAGLAGDLAEVCVYQGPYVATNVSVGLEGVWNNTLYPRLRYFPDASLGRWELTDAEILAGIDGLFLSQQIAAWQRKVRRLRLSQVLDMFYGSRGIPVVGIKLLPSTMSGTRTNSNYLSKRFSTRDDLTSACDRRTVLQLIDRENLQMETYHMAQLLQFRRSSMPVSDETLRTTCAAAVLRFVSYAESLVAALPACSRVKEFAARPVVDMTLVLDGSRSEYESLELVSFLVEAIDVSNSGSWLSVIHGQTGKYMVRRTRSVSSVFEQLHNCSGAFPTGLSVANALQRLSLTLANRTRTERQRAVIAAASPVVLIMSQKQRIDQRDFDSAYSLLHDALMQFSDLYYVFVTNAADQFEELINHHQVASAPPSAGLRQRRQQEHYKIIEARSLDAQLFGAQLSTHLDMIPKRIMAPFCRNNSETEYNIGRSADGGQPAAGQALVFFEDYISPYQEHIYRIGAEQMLSSDVVRVQFHVNYGSVSVCMARELASSTQKCHSIGETDTAEFEVVAPCHTAQAMQRRCDGVYFFVTLDHSEIRCSENRCRYPDQVLLIMRHSGLRCERDDRASGSMVAPWSMLAVILMAGSGFWL